jgi:hypothetical protein
MLRIGVAGLGGMGTVHARNALRLAGAKLYPQLETLGDLDNAAVTVRFDRGGIAALHVSRTCAWGHDVRVDWPWG